MKTRLIVCLTALTVVQLASAQTSLYLETFSGTLTNGQGQQTLSSFGWVNASDMPSEAVIYEYPDGEWQFYMYRGDVTRTAACYTETGLGTGTNGTVAFSDIDPTTWPYIVLKVEKQVSWMPENLTVRFALKMGGSWYASIAPLGTPTLNNDDFESRLLDTGNTNWYDLTITSSNAVIGSVASTNLTGNIQGYGVVLEWTGSQGSWNFDNFEIIGTPTAPVPHIIGFPLTQTNYVGGGVSYGVEATGAPPLYYSWTKDTEGNVLTDGGKISGAATPRLTITNISAADEGIYWADVDNFVGNDDSGYYVLTELYTLSVPSDLLYAETIPYVGPLGADAAAEIGWSNAIPDSPNRVYQAAGGDGAIYAFEGSAATTAFYTGVGIDTGVSGLPFPTIDPSGYPAVSFSVDIMPNYLPADNVSSYIAVQMNGTNWYVSAFPLPVPPVQGTNFVTYSQQFHTNAANWNVLTITNTGAAIGGAAGADLTGNITGAGLVAVHTGAGTHNYDNFLITTNTVAVTPPSLVAAPLSQTDYSGAGVSFAVSAVGQGPLAYAWYKDGSPLADGPNISGANSSYLALTDISAGDAGQYSVIVTNMGGATNSADVVTSTLTVLTPSSDLLYSELFPYVGPVGGVAPVSVVAWGNDIPTEFERLYQVTEGDGSGACYAYQNVPSTTAFYTTSGMDTGWSGLPFPNLNLNLHTELAFSVDVESDWFPSNVTARVAVQVNGGAWYAAATALPVLTATNVWTNYTQTVSRDASEWNTLTLNGSSATIGGPAGSDLSGAATGAGLVFTHSADGSLNFDSFEIRSVTPGGVIVTDAGAGSLGLEWVGGPDTSLESATNLTPPVVWSDVLGTLGTNTASVPMTEPQMYFRSKFAP